MRVYVVEISSSYAEREVSGSFMSSRKPLYREMDRRCYISCCPMERMLRVPLFTVIVFNRPFVDNTEYVKYCVARACHIWEFSYDDRLKEHLKVGEATAKEGLDSPRCEVPFDFLMDALSEAKRLPSSHVYRLRFSPLMKESHAVFRHGTAFEWLNENLVDALSDNVLVIEYGEGVNDDDFDFDLYRMFMHTIEMLNDSLSSVQAVFLLPFGSDFLQERIRRAFMAPLVTIARSKGTAAWRQCDASERLVELARASDVETNSSLESLPERYRCNRVEKPIEGVFSDWVALERTRRGFPAYASSFERFYQPSNAADDAYSRLDDLVGLEKPKRLVREIVGRLRMNRLLA